MWTGLASASAATATGGAPAPAAADSAAYSASASDSASASAARAWEADRSASGISGSSRTTTNPTTMIAAPIRNTSDIESENPTLNGCAMTESSREMNDVSFRSELPCRAACSVAAWSGCAASAAWNEAVPCTERNASAILPGRLVSSTDRKMAVPSVPPICRKNVTDEVATPISFGDTAFWMARMIGCMLPPRPRPTIGMISAVCHSGVSAPISEKRNSPTTMSPVPMIGKIL